MSIHKIGFYEDFTKLSLNYHQISSNTHLISSAVFLCIYINIISLHCSWARPQLRRLKDQLEHFYVPLRYVLLAY